MSLSVYYERDGVKLFHANALEVLDAAKGSIDLVVTDPPFFLPARISQSRQAWPRSVGDLGVMDGFFATLFRAAAARLSERGAAYAFCDSTSYIVFGSVMFPLFDRTQCIVWDKGKGGLGRGWRHAHELIVHGAKKGTAYAEGFRKDVVVCPVVPSRDRSHPAEKPVELLESLIGAHPAGRLLDPFAGTGSTLVAARRQGWDAIGVEIDESFCEIAARRLDADAEAAA